MNNHMMVRNTDPDTSKDAAKSFNPSDLEALVLASIASFPNGCIADDIEQLFPEIRSHSITPRFASLLRNGCIVDTGERRIAKSRRGQRVVKFVHESEREVLLSKTKQSKWVGLTEAELYEITPFVKLSWARKIAQAIETKLKEKNK